MRVVLVALLASAGCGKELNAKFCAAHPDDERCADTVDGALDVPPGQFDIAHLPVSVELMLDNDADIAIEASTTIDTQQGTVSPALAGALVLPSVAQDDGSDVMVIQAGSFAIGADIVVVGDKPLVLVAQRTLTISAAIDVSATGDRPGPGGAPGAMGPGAGGNGSNGDIGSDGGGAGGSFGTLGGAGGDPFGGTVAATYGSAGGLVGGSGGGEPGYPAACLVHGGAGGGAVQLTAFVSLTFDGTIDASGSGGAGGQSCGTNAYGSGGAGGGAGGMVYFESPMLLGNGRVAANGGAGGEGASATGTQGADGGDGNLDGGGVAASITTSGGPGGAGASGTGDGSPGTAVQTNYNGGGGGGGVGRIYVETSGAAPSYTSSPPAAGV